MSLVEEIKSCIKAEIADAEVLIHDPDGTHFSALVISSEFAGILPIKQHRMVMNALKQQLSTDRVHALSLKTFTPEKWEVEKDNYI